MDLLYLDNKSPRIKPEVKSSCTLALLCISHHSDLKLMMQFAISKGRVRHRFKRPAYSKPLSRCDGRYLVARESVITLGDGGEGVVGNKSGMN